MSAKDGWDSERRELLGRRISDLGLHLGGSPLEPLVAQLYHELDERGLVFHPEVYLSDQWGCPSDVPVIGVPFYLADPRLSQAASEAVEIEDAAGEDQDREDVDREDPVPDRDPAGPFDPKVLVLSLRQSGTRCRRASRSP